MNSSWFARLLNLSELPEEGGVVQIDGNRFRVLDGILRNEAARSSTQQQTSDMFAYKWSRQETYDSAHVAESARAWLKDRYGDPLQWTWLSDYSDPVLLDAGCGAGFSASLLLEPIMSRIHYLGVDVSDSVDVARQRFSELDWEGSCLQSDLNTLPLGEASVDIILSEGVLHHTDSTRNALSTLSRHLKLGGRFLFYVYRKKGPIREFTDDYIRDRLHEMSEEETWNALMPLTKLGKALGDLNLSVDVPESIDLLDIPNGKIDIQRLFYWHVFKAFYRPEMTLDEMNHANFDWYAPQNAYRQSPEEVRAWCEEAGLQIERERLEMAGITIVARKSHGA